MHLLSRDNKTATQHPSLGQLQQCPGHTWVFPTVCDLFWEGSTAEISSSLPFLFLAKVTVGSCTSSVGDFPREALLTGAKDSHGDNQVGI